MELPPLIVSPIIATVLPLLILNTWLALLPLTVMLSPLLFLMVTFFARKLTSRQGNCVWSSAGDVEGDRSASAHSGDCFAQRPAPLSAVLVTIGFGVHAITTCATMLL